MSAFTHISEKRSWAEQLLARLPQSGVAPLTPDESFKIQPGSALSLVREAGDIRLHVLLDAANWAFNQNNLEQAAALYTSALDWSLALGDALSAARVTGGLGWIAMSGGEIARGAALIEASIAQVRQLGNDRQAGIELANFAYFLLLAHDEERASVAATEALEIGRQTDIVYTQVFSGAVLAMMAARRNEVERARAFVLEALRCETSVEDAYATPLCIRALAMAEGRRGLYHRAARLLGAADTMFERSGVVLDESEMTVMEPCIAPARAALGEEAWAAAFAAGRALSIEEAIAEALGEDGEYG